MNKKVLILGITGMLGHTLFRYFSKDNNFIIYGTARSLKNVYTFYPKKFIKNIITDIDINNFDKVKKTICKIKPDFVINAIGIIKQLKESEDPITAITINSLIPHKLAKICQSINARMLQISTDCVFSGKKGGYVEEDISDAYDLYGRTKYLGEVNYSNTITIRTSIIGHELKTNKSLIDWFLSQEGKVRGFTNAIYTGFPTIEIAHIIKDVIMPNYKLSGLYHVASKPISKYDLLNIVAKIYKKNIEIEKYEKFYCDRSLNSDKFNKETGYNSPNWEELINIMYNDYLELKI